MNVPAQRAFHDLPSENHEKRDWPTPAIEPADRIQNHMPFRFGLSNIEMPFYIERSLVRPLACGLRQALLELVMEKYAQNPPWSTTPHQTSRSLPCIGVLIASNAPWVSPEKICPESPMIRHTSDFLFAMNESCYKLFVRGVFFYLLEWLNNSATCRSNLRLIVLVNICCSIFGV